MATEPGSQRLERSANRRTMHGLALLLLGSLSGCGSSWAQRAEAEGCGPLPPLSPLPSGRPLEHAGCWLTDAVDRDCASRPPEQGAMLVGSFGGGVPPSDCQELEDEYLRAHHQIPCRCLTAAEIESESTRP
jgi:hypothetical protein